MAADCVVATLAGSTSGYQNGTGSGAQFNNPLGVTGYGDDLLVADTNNHVIRRVTTAGVVTLFAGQAGVFGDTDGTLSGCKLRFPYDVLVGPDGLAYVLCENQDTPGTGGVRIVQLDEAGNAATTVVRIFTGEPGWPGVSPTSFTFAVDSSGNFYVTDEFNSVIAKVTSAGVLSVWLGDFGNSGDLDGTGTAAQIWGPRGITVDDNDNVFFADYQNDKLYKATPAAVMTTLTTQSLGDDTRGLDWRNDRLWATTAFYRVISWADDGTDRTLEAFDENWTVGSGDHDGPALEATINEPWGLDWHGDVLYICDAGNHRIRTYTCPTGGWLVGRVGFG